MDSFQVSWAEFKALVDLWNLKNLVRFTAKIDGAYRVVWLLLDGILFQVLNLTDSTAISEFEASYKPSALTTWVRGKNVLRNDIADEFTAATNSTTNHDIKMVANTWIWGGDLLVQGAVAVDGDSVQVQVVDVDNVLGAGAGYVVRTLITKKFLPNERSISVASPSGEPSFVLANLYLRFKYANASGALVAAKVFDVNLVAMS